ncbi:hypothetical protein K439DRAFT_1070442 [Ramaria rubella]|nr:hypothetical protein K439DRAFT_1070442 [Ramaria rubella]
MSPLQVPDPLSHWTRRTLALDYQPQTRLSPLPLNPHELTLTHLPDPSNRFSSI